MYSISIKRIALLCSLIFIFSSTIQAQVRVKTSINSLWKFNKQEESPSKTNINTNNWEIVNLPHTWNNEDVLDDGNRGYYRGKGWYYKKLEVEFKTSTKNYFLHFEGANQHTKIFVNGSQAGEHKGGYSAFTIDITPYLLKDQSNELLIMVDNAHDKNIPPLSADFTFFGGIYRDVFLIETSKTHFNLLDYGSKGIFVSTPKVSSDKANIQIKGSIRSASKNLKTHSVHYTIYDSKGTTVAQGNTQITSGKKDELSIFLIDKIEIKNPALWSPDTPDLYTLDISIHKKEEVLDREYINFGIRTFSFDANTGFYLNEKPLKLIGANRHQDFPGKGNALSDDTHRSDLRLIKEMGGNFIRLAHYPQDPAILEEADRIGLMVWEETPLVNEVTLSKEHDQTSEIMLKEMIRQHYNHPSVIMWGYMNEIYWAHRFIDKDIVDQHTKATVNLAKKLEAIARKEDPTRYTAMALHKYPLYEGSKIDEIPQIVGWNLYHGWYYDTFDDFGKFLDEQHKKHPNRIHFVSEFGAGSDPRFHSLHPERFDFTIEGHKRMMESYYQQIMERPYISGATVWNLIDFSSERRIDPNPHVNNKGLVSANRKPKDVYFFFKAALSKKPYLKIAETNWTDRSDLQTKKLPVQVYSNLEKIELFQNGKSLGLQKVINHSATWEVMFQEGKNVFEAINPLEKYPKDILTINYKGIPEKISNKDNVDISINSGSNHSFYDPIGKNTWLVDKKYESGSWGYLDGEPLYVAKKIGTKEDILTLKEDIGLYQTMRRNTAGYQFDLKDGWYEVELLFVEHYPKSRRFVDGVESPKHKGGTSVFDVIVNNSTVLKNLDMLKTYGYNYPIRKKVIIRSTKNKGIRVHLKSKQGSTFISAIRIRSL
ncbi:DUF4982 domain-containing protein [Aquimarina sp. U1-2]|uniref:glycoside hydrolase family 2 TIM barrel-domain containing protein n=1 Tax=Aquimarina sp. U1-2 TaxID=2823141 RepID=UPI001AEC8B17|nr:glycoside hydrolase family 2 TIM barrel-domain containing protein [Aquimarina sp. U1-2]MBP2833674.1 DUF4982 domain-containing protein [Aquimarina sp. U1-2]